MNLWSRFRSLHWGLQTIIVLSLVLVFAIATSINDYDSDDIRRQLDEMDKQQHGTELLVQKTASSSEAHPTTSAPSTEPAKAENAYDRILAIVGKYDEYPIISNLSAPNAKNSQPPYEVLVAMENVKSCFSAKDKALNIMRDLYLDPVTSPAIVRVKTIHNEYLSASLGANDARSISADAWRGNGATNFIKALQGGAKYDMDDVQEATSSTVSSYTFAELEAECL